MVLPSVISWIGFVEKPRLCMAAVVSPYRQLSPLHELKMSMVRRVLVDLILPGKSGMSLSRAG